MATLVTSDHHGHHGDPTRHGPLPPEDVVLDEEGVAGRLEDEVLHEGLWDVLVRLERPVRQGNEGICQKYSNLNLCKYHGPHSPLISLQGIGRRLQKTLNFLDKESVHEDQLVGRGHVVDREAKHVVGDEPGGAGGLEQEDLGEPVGRVLVRLGATASYQSPQPPLTPHVPI